MSTRHAILGLLSQQPMTGFELIKEFDVANSVIWPAPQNEVYRILRALKAERLIDEVSAGPRGARTYAVTDAGRAAVADWLAAPSDYSLRYEPILKAVFLAEADPATRRARADADRAFFAEQLATLEARHEEVAARPRVEDSRGDARRMAIGLYRALKAWADAIVREGGPDR